MDKKIYKYVQSLCNDKFTYDEVRYALNIVLSSFIHLISILLISCLFKQLTEGIILSIGYSIIRRFTGGTHLDTPVKCYLYSLITFFIVNLFLNMEIYMYFNYIPFLCMFIFSVIILAIFTPIGSDKRELKPIEKKMYNKITKCILIVYTIIISIMYINRFYTLMAALMMSVILAFIFFAVSYVRYRKS